MTSGQVVSSQRVAELLRLESLLQQLVVLSRWCLCLWCRFIVGCCSTLELLLSTACCWLEFCFVVRVQVLRRNSYNLSLIVSNYSKVRQFSHYSEGTGNHYQATSLNAAVVFKILIGYGTERVTTPAKSLAIMIIIINKRKQVII